MSTAPHIVARPGYQTQNLSEGTNVEYWGFAVRVLPCANDAGTCEYFEAIYRGHELGMLYSGIIWLTIFSILLFWAIGRNFWAAPRARETVSSSHIDSEKSTIATSARARFIRAFAAIR